MTIYLFMCLNDVLGDTYFTDEEDVKMLVEKANKEYGEDCGDFWYKTLTANKE